MMTLDSLISLRNAYCVLSTVLFCFVLFDFSMLFFKSLSFQCFDFILQGLDCLQRETQTLSVCGHSRVLESSHIAFFPKVKIFLYFTLCREAHAAAQRALQKWRGKRQQRRLQRLAQGCWLRVATDCGGQGESIVKSCEIVKWKNGCEEDGKCIHLILMQNVPASCKFWLIGQEVGDVSCP